MTRPSLPAQAELPIARYLDQVDIALPGFVEGLYVVGSLALGAWQDGPSDIDALILTSRTAGAAEVAALAKIHEGMAARPYLDVVYLDPDTLAAQPMDMSIVPFVVNGQFRTEMPCGELNPVVWLTLQRYGLPVRGPAIADLGVEVDPGALRRFNVDNLQAYWAPLAQAIRTAVEGLPDGELADNTQCPSDAVVWCVLGPARLHFTLAKGDVISKAGAAAYLAEILPAYGPLADRAVRCRQGEQVGFTVADAHAAANSIDAVVADAVRRWG